MKARRKTIDDSEIKPKAYKGNKKAGKAGFGMSGITELVKEEANNTKHVHLISQLEAANK